MTITTRGVISMLGFIIAGGMVDFPSWNWAGVMFGCALVHLAGPE